MKMRLTVFIKFAALFLVFAELNGQTCDDKKKLRIIKRSLQSALNALKDQLADEGCKILSENVDDQQKVSVKSPATTQNDSDGDEQVTKKSTRKPKAEDKCAAFEPVTNIPFSINCFYSSADMKHGFQIEKLVRSKLCTEIFTSVKHVYEDANGKASFKFLNPSDDEPNIAAWRENFQVFMQIGSWGDPKQLTGQQFSKILSMPKATERFMNAIIDNVQRSKMHGVLISWYFPGCFQDDCTTGPLTDEKQLLNFLKRLSELIATKALKIKLALEVSIWPESIYMGFYSLEKLANYVDLLLFENTSPENRVYLKDMNEYKYFSKAYTSFGTLDNAVRNGNQLQSKFKLITKKQKFMELETITIYMTPTSKNTWRVMNITNRNLCNLVQSAPQISKDESFKWPLPTVNISTDYYPFNDYDYIKAKVEQYAGPLNFDGVWIRDIWADDTENECGCGSFPILRAANEAIGRSTCRLPNCPTK